MLRAPPPPPDQHEAHVTVRWSTHWPMPWSTMVCTGSPGVSWRALVKLYESIILIRLAADSPAVWFTHTTRHRHSAPIVVITIDFIGLHHKVITWEALSNHQSALGLNSLGIQHYSAECDYKQFQKWMLYNKIIIIAWFFIELLKNKRGTFSDIV